MVDGVSANIGVSGSDSGTNPGNGFGGTLGSFSALGGTNSLVSVDALQEFRIQTSTYSPEFGRTPGGQISIVTRSGTNLFHGTAFDYLRNDVLDANDWFANEKGLKKPEERQNDFGGTFSGPILKNQTFFFFSYEGLRLRLPQVAQSTVPDVNARQSAIPAVQPFLNAFPVPNGPDNTATGIAQFNASFSNSSTLDAYSLRIDQKLGSKWNLFGRYNYSPSNLVQRAVGTFRPLSDVTPINITTQTGTVGTTWNISTVTANDLRFNYSRTNENSSTFLDNFGGAVPPASVPLPSPFTMRDSAFFFFIPPLQRSILSVGKNGNNLQRQTNVVDSLATQWGAHSIKLGVDFRRLSPVFDPRQYFQRVLFSNMAAAESGNVRQVLLQSFRSATLLFHNVGVFAQDTWRAAPRLTLTYGLRWDVDFAPSSSDGPALPAVTGYNLSNLSTLALAPAGTSPFRTPYGNIAPRVGVAYQLSQKQGWETVVRGGFGVFYDLASSEVGNILGTGAYPFGTFTFKGNATFPVDSTTAAPPPINPPNATSGILTAFDPNLKLPYTLQWNVALEQALGSQQTLSASYIGSTGRRLIQSADVLSPNSNYAQALLVGNSASSDYNALQLQFQRRMSRGLQALASYTWSHSIDDGSAGSVYVNASNGAVGGQSPNTNRGPSDFDIRHGFSAALVYEFPAPKISALADTILRGWSVESVVQARSAATVDVFNSAFFPGVNGFITNVHPDVVSGQAFYLHGGQFPGGKALNPAAFMNPPTTPAGCNPGPPSFDFPCDPTRQGNLGRNALRGFGATQWDFAVHRDFPIHELLKLQFRAELFNVLNHPNFGQPIGDLSGFSGTFGQSIQMLGQSLNNNNLGGGAFNPLYQIGGPRSIQFALKLIF
jgi:hypothetical protein